MIVDESLVFPGSADPRPGSLIFCRADDDIIDDDETMWVSTMATQTTKVKAAWFGMHTWVALPETSVTTSPTLPVLAVTVSVTVTCSGAVFVIHNVLNDSNSSNN